MGSFYTGRTVLVTGHTGFKGAWLSFWLSRLGAQVVGLSLPEAVDKNRALFQPAVASSLALDVRDHAGVVAAMRAHAPEIVFHLAAQSLVGRSVDDPIGTFATNVMGTAHVLDAAYRAPRTRVVINVTSDKCYANPGAAKPFREDDALGGKDPYSASKACSEIVTAAWRDSIRRDPGLTLATVRAGNVIGGGDYSESRLLPDIVRAVLAGQPVVLRHPNATRPWQHVLDPIAGYLLLARRLYERPERYAGAWNFGPAPRASMEVRQLAGRILRRWGKGTVVESTDSSMVPEAPTLALDPTKAEVMLGWRPRVTFDQIIGLTVDWYQRVLERHDDPLAVSDEQISAFEASNTGEQTGPLDAAAGKSPV